VATICGVETRWNQLDKYEMVTLKAQLVAKVFQYALMLHSQIPTYFFSVMETTFHTLSRNQTFPAVKEKLWRAQPKYILPKETESFISIETRIEFYCSVPY